MGCGVGRPVGGQLKKRFDPLWEIVGEKVTLQGIESSVATTCPNCQVTLELPKSVQPVRRFRCGLCGALCEIAESPSVADDGTAEIVARLAK
jgi:hypothetical protein